MTISCPHILSPDQPQEKQDYVDQPDLSFDVKIPLQNTLLKIRLYCKRSPVHG